MEGHVGIPTPGQARAMAHIAARRTAGNTRLPSVKQMAAECGVAYATMWKGVRAEARAGRLRCRPGRGIEVVAEPQPVRNRPLPAAADRPRWRHVLKALRSDITHAAFAPGEVLPTLGVLQARYGVCYATMRMAMERAAESGDVHYERRRWVVPVVRAPDDFYTVYIAARGDPGQPHVPMGAMAKVVYEHIAGGCMRRGIVPRMIPFHYIDRRLVTYRRTNAFPQVHHSVLGVVVLASGLGSLDTPEYTSRLCAAGHSVALVDDLRTVAALESLPGRGRVQWCVPSGDHEAGRQVGRALVSLGHRYVAWVSPFDGVAWSQQRLAGLRSVVEQEGGGKVEAAVAVMPAPVPGEWQSVRELVEGAQAAGGLLAPAVRQTLLHRDMAGRFGGLRSEQRRREVLLPLVDRVVQRRGVTAMVAASDAVAMVCMERLAQRGVQVPRGLSVVSFDDREEASYFNLTSYTFNAPGMADAALAFLLRPPAARRGEKRPETVVVPGRLVMRHSLAAAPA